MDTTNVFDTTDDVLIVRKELIKALGGLNEAIILNQVHYWIEKNKQNGYNNHDGHFWVYSTYEAWQERDFEFLSLKTIIRVFKKLESLGVIVVAKYNKSSYNQTRWYTIDYEVLQKLIDKSNKKDKGGKGKGLKTTEKQDGEIDVDNLGKSLKETKTDNNNSKSYTTLNNTIDTYKALDSDELQPYNDILTYEDFSNLKDINTYARVEGLDDVVDNYIDNHNALYNSEDVVYTIDTPKEAPKGFVKYTGIGRGLLKVFNAKGIEASDWRFKNLLSIVEYFLGEYPKYSTSRLFDLSEKHLKTLVESYLYDWDDEYSEQVYDFDSYKKMIDAYMDTDYTGTYKCRGIRKSIMHFFSGKIRVNLAYKVLI